MQTGLASVGASEPIKRVITGGVIVAAALLASYTLYWYHGGNDYGPRYWYLTILPLVWFTVQGATRMRGRVVVSVMAPPGPVQLPDGPSSIPGVLLW